MSIRKPVTRAARAEANGQRLLEAARAVFVRRGYMLATLDEIAAAAGLTKGAVYARFASKADLLLALLERRIDMGDLTLDEDTEDSLRTISSESRRMAEILETFLDLARAESQQIELEVEEADLVEVLDDELVRLEAKNPEAVIHRAFESAELPIETDVRRLRQVLANLLDNALKYGGSPPEIWVTAASRDGRAELSIRDNGEGISAEDRQQLFSRFYRGSARSGPRKGLGIGLYLSRQFAERLGGSLELESPPDTSAVFVLRLPLSK